MDAVPIKVFLDFGLDFDRWYAAPRTLLDKARFAAGRKRKRPKYQAALDTVAATYGVRCGPVVSREPGSL